MIDPGHPAGDEPEQIAIEFEGKLKGISTTETDWGTRTAYDVTIRTYNPNALVLGTIKTGTKLNVKVAPNGSPQQANTKRQQK